MMYAAFGELLDEDTYDQLSKEIEEKFVSDNGLFKSYKDFNFSELSSELRQKIIDVYNIANNTIDSETEKVRPVLEAYLYGATSGYDSLKEDAKQAVQHFINNINSSFYSSFSSTAEAQSWIKENVIKPLQDGADSSDLAIRFQTLFSLNENDFSNYHDYVNAVQNIINLNYSRNGI